jgi:hypothetical protein
MALVNILPSWVVLIGRDLILALAGEAPSAGDNLPYAPAASVSRR